MPCPFHQQSAGKTIRPLTPSCSVSQSLTHEARATLASWSPGAECMNSNTLDLSPSVLASPAATPAARASLKATLSLVVAVASVSSLLAPSLAQAARSVTGSVPENASTRDTDSESNPSLHSARSSFAPSQAEASAAPGAHASAAASQSSSAAQKKPSRSQRFVSSVKNFIAKKSNPTQNTGSVGHDATSLAAAQNASQNTSGDPQESIHASSGTSSRSDETSPLPNGRTTDGTVQSRAAKLIQFVTRPFTPLTEAERYKQEELKKAGGAADRAKLDFQGSLKNGSALRFPSDSEHHPESKFEVYKAKITNYLNRKITNEAKRDQEIDRKLNKREREAYEQNIEINHNGKAQNQTNPQTSRQVAVNRGGGPPVAEDLLTLRVKALQEKLASLPTENPAHRAVRQTTLDQLAQDAKQLATEKRNVTEEVLEQQEVLANQAREKQQLPENHVLSKALKEKWDHKKTIDTSINQKKQEITQLRQSIPDAQRDKNGKLWSIQEFEAALQTHDSRLAAANAELVHLLRAHNEVVTDATDAGAVKKANARALKELRKTKAIVRTALKEHTAKLAVTEGKIRTAQSKLDALHSALNVATAANQTRTESSQVRDAKVAAQQASAQKRADLSAQIAALNAQLEEENRIGGRAQAEALAAARVLQEADDLKLRTAEELHTTFLRAGEQPSSASAAARTHTAVKSNPEQPPGMLPLLPPPPPPPAPAAAAPAVAPPPAPAAGVNAQEGGSAEAVPLSARGTVERVSVGTQTDLSVPSQIPAPAVGP